MSTLTRPAPAPAPTPPPYATPRPVRRALAAAGGVLGVVLVAFGSLNLLDLAARHTTEQRTSHAGVRALVVEDASDIRLTGAPAGARLEVVARVTEGLQSPERSIAQDARGTLRLASSCPGFLSSQCRIRYEIRVPAGTSVRADADGGDVAASGIDAPELELTTDAGDVEATRIRAARVLARSDAGDVGVALLERADRLDAGTSAGDVELIVPDAAYRLDASAESGDVDSSDVRTDPEGRRVIRARADAGDVRIVVRR